MIDEELRARERAYKEDPCEETYSRYALALARIGPPPVEKREEFLEYHGIVTPRFKEFWDYGQTLDRQPKIEWDNPEWYVSICRAFVVATLEGWSLDVETVTTSGTPTRFWFLAKDGKEVGGMKTHVREGHEDFWFAWLAFKLLETRREEQEQVEWDKMGQESIKTDIEEGWRVDTNFDDRYIDVMRNADDPDPIWWERVRNLSDEDFMDEYGDQ